MNARSIHSYYECIQNVKIIRTFRTIYVSYVLPTQFIYSGDLATFFGRYSFGLLLFGRWYILRLISFYHLWLISIGKRIEYKIKLKKRRSKFERKKLENNFYYAADFFRVFNGLFLSALIVSITLQRFSLHFFSFWNIALYFIKLKKINFYYN